MITEPAAIRAAQLADQIRDYLATWVAREYPGSFLVVSAVTLAPNMHKAVVCIKFPGDDVRLYSKLRKRTSYFQHQLTLHMTRFRVPRIVFTIDTRPELPDLPK
jgi:ribosome-binding factor A